MRKLKKRFIILNGFLLLSLLISFVFVAFFTDTYTYVRHEHILEDLSGKDKELLKAKTDSDCVEVKDIDISGDTLTVKLKAVKSGNVHLELYVDDTSRIATYYDYIQFRVFFDRALICINPLDFSNSRVIMSIIEADIFLTVCVLVFSIIDYIRKSRYCYSLAVCTGVALYLFTMLVLTILSSVADYEKTFASFLRSIVGASSFFVYALSPFVFLLALFVSISNLFLIIKEGFRFVNLLGMIFSLLWIIGIVLSIITAMNSSGEVHEAMLWGSISMSIDCIICYVECMLFAVIFSAFRASRHKPPYDRDYIMILGCGILKNGRLTPLLKSRSVAALDFEKTQFEKTGKHAVFVPSGGQGSDEIISESEAIERYLIKKGIPRERIIREDKSTSTYENLKFSRERIEERCEGREYKSAFATTSYHIFRGYVLSDNLGFKTEGIAAKTKWYFSINAFLREFVGLLVQEKKKHIFVLISIVLFSVLVGLTLY